MAFEKIFDFLHGEDESNIIQSLLEHTRIDHEELGLLKKMVLSFQDHAVDIAKSLENIESISLESKEIFENTANHIIQSKFNQQKQNDLLRIYQRIDDVSHSILNCAKYIHTFNQVNLRSFNPTPLLLPLIDNTFKSHVELINILTVYQHRKSDILSIIHQISEDYYLFGNLSTNSIEEIYHMANKDQLKAGEFRALECSISQLSELSNTIHKAATSFDYLILNS